MIDPDNPDSVWMGHALECCCQFCEAHRMEELRDELEAVKSDNEALRQRVAELEGIIKEVYQQCGNHAPAKRRHALTPAIRDQMRDYLYPTNQLAKQETS